MIPPEFAQTGLCVTRPTDAPVTRFQVLGERSSGTNFIKRLLGRNTALTPTETLGWKHGFPQAMAIPRDLAVICVVRRADPWALSMYTKPWHTTAQMQALTFDQFLRAGWDTVIDRPRYFDDLDPDLRGQSLQQDRDPLTGARFANLFALRRAKLAGLISYLGRDCTCILVRMERAQADPEATLDALVAALGVQRTGEFRPVVKRLGSRFKPADGLIRADAPEHLSPQDMGVLRAHLDLPFEARLGYSYDL